MDIEFPRPTFRGRCLNVVDGDTVDLELDIGFHHKMVGRFRLLGVDTCELRSKLLVERDLARKAKEFVISVLKPKQYGEWDLLVTTEKDPDNFGRWLVTLQYIDENNSQVNLNNKLLMDGLAVPFKG